MRNPFPQIGKVIKYEFKHTSRIFLPMYVIILVLGLALGLSINAGQISAVWASESSDLSINSSNSIQGLFISLLFLTSFALSIVTLVMIENRFKKELVGEEAYVNLSLPVTAGEHIWGRFIMSFGWLVLCNIVEFVAFMLCFVRVGIFKIIKYFFTNQDIIDELSESNLTWGKLLGFIVLVTFSIHCVFITFVYAVNSIKHIIKDMKTILEIIIIIALVILYVNSFGFMSDFNLNQAEDFTKIFLSFAGINLLYSIVNFGFTHFVFTKKINLA